MQSKMRGGDSPMDIWQAAGTRTPGPEGPG
jgi:hypothetical protein